jgi:hypothetical protein
MTTPYTFADHAIFHRLKDWATRDAMLIGDTRDAAIMDYLQARRENFWRIFGRDLTPAECVATLETADKE